MAVGIKCSLSLSKGHFGYTFPMNKYSVKIVLAALALCLLVSACGNKGPLVKPDETPAEAEAKQ